jgi:hypothetical protein
LSGSETPIESELPYVVAMLTCNLAITEAGSNKKTLVGIFDKVSVKGVPAQFHEFCSM